MEQKNNKIEIRSTEVQEILGQVPNWMIRWGITLIFGLIIMLLIISWFVKYPDIVQGEVTLTTEQPPSRLVSRTNGYIAEIYHPNDTYIQKGEIIAQIANPVEKETIDTLRYFINNFSLNNFSTMPELLSKVNSMGEAQSEINNLYSYLLEYEELLNNSYFRNAIKNLDAQIDYNNKLAQVTTQQLELLAIEVNHAKEKLKADSLLYANKVIAKHTFYSNQSEYVAKEQQEINTRRTFLQYKIAANDYFRQKNEMQKTFDDKKQMLEANIHSSIKSLKSYIENWQLNYILISPMDGKLSYLENLSENQFVKAQQALFAVIPDNEQIIGVVSISENGYGKIKLGQKVRFKLHNYPYHEYGQLVGEVSNISKIASDEGYIVKVKLEQGLLSTYNKELTYKPEMTGVAEIVTEDLRLIERIFYSLRKIFDK